MMNIAGTDIYYYDAQYFEEGVYEYYIWVIDTMGNINITPPNSFYILITPHLTFTQNNTENTLTITTTDTGLWWNNIHIKCTNDTTTTTIEKTGPIEQNDTIHIKDAELTNNITVHLTWIPTSHPLGHFNFTITHILKSYNIATSINPPESGYIVLDPLSAVYIQGTLISVIANANAGYSFEQWSGDARGNKPSIQITMNSNKSIIALFEPIRPSNEFPTVMITSPSDGANVSGVVSIQGTAYDDNAIEKVEVRIDEGEWIHANGNISWSYAWNTANISNGFHTIQSRGYDGEFYSKIVSITVNVFRNHKPYVNILFPINGSEVGNEITIHGTGSDPDGDKTIEKVEIKISGNNWVVVSGTIKWNYIWDTTNAKNIEHVIKARIYDGYEYSNIVSIKVKVKNEGEMDIPSFEMFFMLIAAIVGLLLKRRKKILLYRWL
jgi:hypothetical protein